MGTLFFQVAREANGSWGSRMDSKGKMCGYGKNKGVVWSQYREMRAAKRAGRRTVRDDDNREEDDGRTFTV
jgi:hypothetical protein